MSNINDQQYSPDTVAFTGASIPASKGSGGTFIPISDGSRNYRMSKGKLGVEIRQSRSNPNNKFVTAHVVGTVVDGPDQGKKQSFFWNEFANSFTQTNPETGEKTRVQLPSDLESLCRLAGIEVPIGQPMSRDELVQYVEQALSAQPIINLGTQWIVEGKVQNPTTGKSYNKTLLKGMKNFPQNADGTYNPEVTIDGQLYKAELKVYFHEPASTNGASA